MWWSVSFWSATENVAIRFGSKSISAILVTQADPMNRARCPGKFLGAYIRYPKFRGHRLQMTTFLLLGAFALRVPNSAIGSRSKAIFGELWVQADRMRMARCSGEFRCFQISGARFRHECFSACRNWENWFSCPGTR